MILIIYKTSIQMFKFFALVILGIIHIPIRLCFGEIGHAIVSCLVIYSWFMAVNCIYLVVYPPKWVGLVHLIIIFGYFYREGNQLMKGGLSYER